MNDKRENGVFVISLLVVVAMVCALSFLASCGTSKKTTTETVSFKVDTVTIVKADTVVKYQVVKSSDTIKTEKVKTITLLQPIDRTLPPETIRVDTNTDTKQISNLKDSVSSLKVALSEIAEKLQEKETHQEKVVKRVIPFQEYLMFLAVVALVLACSWIVCGRTKNNNQ